MGIQLFSDRYPLLGPSIWMLSAQYFLIQLIVADNWQNPAYSFGSNTISDLGNTVCGFTRGRLVCSPLHALMNSSFICLGILMASGALLIYQEFRQGLASLVGFSLMALAGFGTLVVGLFPENTISLVHSLGASLPFLIGNLSLIILSIALKNIPKALQIFGWLAGLLAIVGLAFFITKHYLGLGIGGMERVVAYPQTVWLILFGLYMIRRQLVSKHSKTQKA